MNALTILLPLVAARVDETPKPEDVKAGWTALVVFVLLAVAVGLLMVSMVRHLRKAQDNSDHGVFEPSGEPPRHTS